jgi:ATP-binding cassette subfamily C protein CydC
MTALLTMLVLFRRAHPGAFAGGLALMLVTLAGGALLLGLSGWFITACAVAGAAGAGAGFDFFRPSAGVRFLALGRAAARWGERVTTHDATLRFLADLRLRLFRGLTALPWTALGPLRRGMALNRLTADVDALDGLYLRLAAPPVALALTLALAAALLGWLVSGAVALAVTGLLALAAMGAMGAGIVLGRRAAMQQALALEALRVRLIDLASGVADLAVAGRLADQQAAIACADARAQADAARLDRLDRGLAAGITLTGAAAAGAALALGAAAGLPAETVAIGVFAALALTEGVAPLRRAGLEAGRMQLAARRLVPALAAEATPAAPRPTCTDATLVFEGAGFAHPGRAAVVDGLTLAVAPGEWIALTGPSGGGKSTALLLAAGLLAPTAGCVRLGGTRVSDWPETALRAHLALLPQRSDLLLGTVGDNLRLAAPDAADDALWAALEDVGLAGVVHARGGLDMALGEGGRGLSGGEARRLALARLLLREAPVVLLDEPTEGLDTTTAERVLRRLRARLSGAAVLTASHRPAETGIADRVLRIG